MQVRLRVDTVADAVVFPSDVATTLADTRRVFWEKQQVAFDTHVADAKAARERERALRPRFFDPDPIVTTQLGSATAVIVQYGDFPIEHAVIDRVLHSTSLI